MTDARPTRTERVRGALYGLLIGDAAGVPFEFHPPDALPDLAACLPDDSAPQLPADFPRAHPSVPLGTWSDDGSQALALLDSLLSAGGVDADDFGQRLLAWWDQGAYTPDGVAFDIGNQTRDALLRLRGGAPAASAGGADEYDNGNGSLMRVLPLALWHRGDDASLVDGAHRQSRVTHAHPRSEACCALYALWARRILDDHPDPWTDAATSLRHLYASAHGPHPGHLAELDRHVLRPFVPRGTGYVVDSLHAARVALRGPDYPSVIRRAIAFGHDTDTTAAIAGGIAGLMYGERGIPEAWRAGLRGRDAVDAQLTRLFA